MFNCSRDAREIDANVKLFSDLCSKVDQNIFVNSALIFQLEIVINLHCFKGVSMRLRQFVSFVQCNKYRGLVVPKSCHLSHDKNFV